MRDEYKQVDLTTKNGYFSPEGMMAMGDLLEQIYDPEIDRDKIIMSVRMKQCIANDVTIEELEYERQHNLLRKLQDQINE